MAQQWEAVEQTKKKADIVFFILEPLAIRILELNLLKIFESSSKARL